MLGEPSEIDNFESQFSDFYRKGVFAVTNKQLTDHFYWLTPSQLQKKLSELILAGKVVQSGELYTFSVFRKTLERLYQLVRSLRFPGDGYYSSLAETLFSPIAVIHTVFDDKYALVNDLIKRTEGNVFLITQDPKAYKGLVRHQSVNIIDYSNFFTETGQRTFISSIRPQDRVVVIDGNFMTMFLFYLCVAGVTKPDTLNQAYISILIDQDYDASIFAGGFLRFFYTDLSIPFYRHSSLIANNKDFLRDFVDGVDYYKFAYLNESELDQDIFLSVYKLIDKSGLNIIQDVVFLSTVYHGRFSVKHTKWVIARILELNGIDVAECEGIYYFKGEKVRAKSDALSMNYADEYEITAIDKSKDRIELISLIDSNHRYINAKELRFFASSSFIHIKDISHEHYQHGVLIMPLAGLHAVSNSDVLRFIACFHGHRFILSQKVYLAHALTNKLSNNYENLKEFLK
jgi:hypothetical protein